MIRPTELSAAPQPSDQTGRLLETATADFRANLRHSRSISLLVGYYLKQGLTAEQVRQAVRNASTAATRSIRLDLPAHESA